MDMTLREYFDYVLHLSNQGVDTSSGYVDVIVVEETKPLFYYHYWGGRSCSPLQHFFDQMG